MRDTTDLANQKSVTKIEYSGLRGRFGARIIDILILIPLAIGTSYIDVPFFVKLLVTIVVVAYKPLMEFVYGATFGKMVMGLKVTDLEFERAGLLKILVRNIFDILFGLFTISFQVTGNTNVQLLSGYEQLNILSFTFNVDQLVSSIATGIGVLNALVLLSDAHRRSLCDMIAGTFVVTQKTTDTGR